MPGRIIRSVRPSVETARQEWEAGHRHLSAGGDPARRERLLAQVDAVTDELRRRVGQTFTLAELADAYREAERWSREVVSARMTEAGVPDSLATVEAAAFHLYSRGATDFQP